MSLVTEQKHIPVLLPPVPQIINIAVVNTEYDTLFCCKVTTDVLQMFQSCWTNLHRC